jgi:hypothetical protein
MDRIGGPHHIREGIQDALTQGIGVTAKITWLTQARGQAEYGVEGRPRWIHCTPLLGSDDKVGVWMIGMSTHIVPDRCTELTSHSDD